MSNYVDANLNTRQVLNDNQNNIFDLISFDEINNLGRCAAKWIFNFLYNKYNEFLDSLTPDKIVCMFNIIIDGLILSSFFSVLSLMLSENKI
jgi:hypothetical protein